jgi:general secretion pathway protein L
MQIDALLKRWIETLATLYLAWRERARERLAITVGFERQHLVVRRARSDKNAHPDFPPGQILSADAARAARGSFVILEFPPDRLVMRNISVPTQAEKFLAGVVHNQIDRLSPWPVSNLAYGFATGPSGDNPAAVDVRILMASRTDIDAVLARLAALGLQADRIVAATDTTAEERITPVTLWSRARDASSESLADASRLVAVSVGAAVALTLTFSLWALVSGSLIRHESEHLAARVKTLQQKVQASRAPPSLAATPPAERAWRAKESAIAGMIVLETVSRALPDSAYLTEIRLEGATLRLTGIAADVPGLLAPLERSGHLTGVHFSAPATRGSDGKFRFSIEAQVEPHIKVAEE